MGQSAMKSERFQAFQHNGTTVATVATCLKKTTRKVKKSA
jgi:hypothetical protein